MADVNWQGALGALSLWLDRLHRPLAGGRWRALNLLLALLLSAILLWWPQPLMDHAGKADHGLATLHLWWICAAYIHGVGFEPRFWLWRLLFSPWLSLPGNGWGLWLVVIALS